MQPQMTRGAPGRPGYPTAVRDFAVELMRSHPEWTIADVSRRTINFWRINYRVRPPWQRVPRSTMREWAAAAGLAPRKAGRPRKAVTE